MGSSRNLKVGISFSDMLQLSEEVGHEHGIRVRVSINPLPGRERQQRHAVLVTPYAANGRRIVDVAPEQLLWPSVAHKTFEGAVVYLLHKLDAALDEWERTKLAEQSYLDSAGPSPLENYIAKSF